jgi:hypothetical protein
MVKGMKKYKIFATVCLLIFSVLTTFTDSLNDTAKAQNTPKAYKAQDLNALQLSPEELQLVEAKLSSKAASQNIIPPIKKKKMVAWLKAGLYKELFIGEPAVHGSLGPHGGNVRIFYNPILVENLRAGKKTWDVGAAMVKELYLGSTTQVSGYSVMIKVDEQSGNDGSGWVYYESFNGSLDGAFYGRAVQICANCHRGGVDYLLAGFRP